MVKATAVEALRRFWWVVLAFAIGGLLIGAVPEPSSTADAQVTYRADHTLLVSSTNGTLFSDPVAVNQITLYATTGEVPKRVAAKLGLSSPGEAASYIRSATVDPTTGALVIEAEADDPQFAEQVADTFADELTSYMAELQQNEATDRADALLARSQQLESDIEELQRKVATNPDDRILQAQLDALSREYSVVFEEQYGASADQQGTLVLKTQQSAEAFEVQEATGLGAPTSRLGRGAWGFVLGALVGAGVALLLSRLDRRIRSRAQAEHLFGAEASVVVPDAGSAGSSLAVRADRHDQLSDSFRTLRSVITFADAGRTATGAGERGGTIVVVVSPGSGDGKTSIAANLAAALAEGNKRTVAVNTDFRRPSLAGRLLGDAPAPPPRTLDELTSIPPSQLLRRTDTNNLVLLDFAGTDAPPSALARETTRLLTPLAKIADAIVIDTSPLGATAEVLELLPFADHVVVAIRLDHTLTTVTQRSMQLLRSLTTGALHLVVVGENIERSPYYEYGNSKGRRARQAKQRKDR